LYIFIMKSYTKYTKEKVEKECEEAFKIRRQKY